MKRLKESARFLSLTTAMLVASPAWPCSTVGMTNGDTTVVAKSYDFQTGLGHVLINKRGMAKVALLPPTAKQQPARWQAKYGSVTFNQFGRELPVGGMNDQGLVVEIMWLNETVYPAVAGRPALSEAQWIQYQLDNFKAVDEVVAHAADIAVSAFAVPVHYMACDTTGACATFEFLDGKLVVHSGEEMRTADQPINTLTNSTYAESRRELARYEPFGGTASLPSTSGSLDRFVRASAAQKAFDPSRHDAVDYAFKTLESVEQANFTRWQIVYEPKARRVHFRTVDALAIKTLDLDDLDLSCESPTLWLDVNSERGGDVREAFAPYSTASNFALIKSTYRVLPGNIPESLARAVAAYPEQATKCRL